MAGADGTGVCPDRFLVAVSGLLRRSGTVPPLQPDPLAVQVTEAQAKLREAVTRAGLKQDPYLYVLDALSDTIATLPLHAQRIEAARQPVRDYELQQAVIAGVQACAADVIRMQTWRTLIVGVAVMAAVAAAAVAGTWWWCQDHLTANIAGIERHLTSPDAAGWRGLIENNDLTGVFAAAEKANACGSQNGRMACTLPLWVGPLPPPAVPAKQ
jgi:hypothetical protein